jgi:hypothetical protein
MRPSAREGRSEAAVVREHILTRMTGKLVGHDWPAFSQTVFMYD